MAWNQTGTVSEVCQYFVVSISFNKGGCEGLRTKILMKSKQIGCNNDPAASSRKRESDEGINSRESAVEGNPFPCPPNNSLELTGVSDLSRKAQ